jgi:hypothetical protein
MNLNPSDRTFQHEYGRYLQSQAQGITYLTFTAIPDLFSSGNGGKTARDGNSRALSYFNKNYGGLGTGFTWDFVGNPIQGYNPALSINDPVNQAALENNVRRPKVLDFLLAATIYTGLGILIF